MAPPTRHARWHSRPPARAGDLAMHARTFLLAASLALLSACASAPATPVATAQPATSAQLAAALAAPGRTDADRERDARDHPAELIALAGFGPGMTIADVFGGGGYYSEILSNLV